MAQDVTREEFELVKQDLEKLTIRHEVLASGVDRLSQQVGDLREDLNALRAEMHARFDEQDARFATRDEVNKRFDALETVQTAILSAVLKLQPR